MLVVRPTSRPQARPVYTRPQLVDLNTNVKVNVIELETEYQLELAAPGLTKADFELQVEKELLTISAKKDQAPQEGVKVLRNEFGKYDFKRSFHLADTINTENITASYTNGILKVVLAKKEKEAPKVVTVK
ncbi:MAG: Hsp20/alpha crystallin family protein [Saprospiraceae bacterium]|nr:Hsp20/alpha crystallin family protein [Saprospiraceae bacterium]MCB9324252.1 Hsp20/alpha crystallin family protein [Lewinellaceae bacterium]